MRKGGKGKRGEECEEGGRLSEGEVWERFRRERGGGGEV